MKTNHFKLLLVFSILVMTTFIYGQTFVWEEDFAVDPGTWTLESHWSITSGYLQFYWSPTTENYNFSATSPVITIPDNAGDLHVTQWVNYYSYVDEAFEIAVLVDGTPTVLWTHSGTDWGADGGQLLTLSLVPFQNQDVQLRFRSWGTSTWNINWWRIYHLAIEGSFDNDLQALSLTGPNSATVGIPVDYTIAVRNAGMNTQSDYTVKLMQEGGIELGSTAGTTIEQGQVIDYVFTWTPDVAGATYLYGEVVLTDDEVPGNNITPNLNVAVQPSGTAAVNIGTDTTTANTLPLNFFYRNSMSQTIYMASELNIGGLLTGITYYSNFTQDLPNMPVKIWVGETDLDNLSAGWIPATQLQLVFDGTIDFPIGQNTINIALQNPYAYSGSNLVILANRPMDTQYYQSTNHFFYSVTAFANRSRNVQADATEYFPDNPPTTGTLTNRVPNTTLYFVTAGMGVLDGYVYNSDTNDPLAGAAVEVIGTNYNAVTNNNGYFVFPYVPEGTYDVKASIFGYNDLILEDVLVEEDETTTISFYLVQLDNVTVSGQVVGSDQPTVGLVGGLVNLTGYENYSTTTGANGMFSIPGVYTNQTYNISVMVEGYAPYTGQVTVGEVDLDVGVIIVDEIAYPPYNVVATQSPDDTYVDLIWSSPLAIDYYFSDFENDDGGWEATADWHPVGDWEWANNYDVNNWYNSGSDTATPPPFAYSGTGLWGTVIFTNHTNSGGFSYLSQTFDFTTFTDATMIFWSWNDSFGNFDYGQVRVNGQIVWGPAWDYTNTQWQEVVIDLSAFDGLSEVEIVFEHYATTVVNYAGWYIDDVYIGSEPQGRRADNIDQSFIDSIGQLSSRNFRDSNRVLEGFRIYRFLNEDTDNEDNWVELATVTDTTYTDNGWATVDGGYYRYGVKSVHTNDVVSAAAISNWVGKDLTTNVTVNITTNDGTSAEGAEVTLFCLDQDPDGNSPVYTQVAVGSFPAVAQFNNVLQGNYDLEVTLTGYATYTQSNIPIQDVTVLDVMVTEIPFPVSNVIAELTAENNVDLIWNTPGSGVLTEFRYDDGVQVAQLGSTGGTNNTVLGAVHRRDAQIHEVTWMTTSEGGPHNAINLFIFGLNAAGMPNGNDILFSQMNVPNVDMQWNVFELPDPIDAPNGFLVGLSYAGFLGLATDDGLGDPWAFVPNTQFFTGDYTGNVWDPIENFSFFVSYLLRAIGYDYGELTRTAEEVAVSRDTRAMDSRPSREVIGLSTGSSSPRGIKVDGPVYKSRERAIGYEAQAQINRETRALEGYLAYRFLAQDQGNENLWSEIGTITSPTDTTYTDTEWSTLDAGVYQYAIKAIYTNNVLSAPAFSNTLEHSMTSLVTINLTTNSGDPVTGTLVTLINDDGDPNHVYTMSSPASGIVVFPNVWRGTYTIEAHLAGFEHYEAFGVPILDDTFMYDIELIELLLPVVELTYDIFDNNNITLNWYEPGHTFGEYWENGFETGQLPAGWAITGVNTDASGPTPGYWTVNNYSSADYSPIGQYHCGLWWSYNHQDEWLKTPEFVCPPNAELVYWTVGYLGSTYADHYYVKVSTDGGSNWTVLQDLSAMTGGWNYYNTPMSVSLASYAGQEIMLAWQAVDGPTNDGLWYIWYVDDISVGDMTFRATDLISESKGTSQTTRTSSIQRDIEPNRAFTGYKVMRNDVVLVEGLQELTYTDLNVPTGTYVYGVIAQYTSGEAEAVETEEISFVGTDDDNILVPLVTELRGNYPNPFNPDTNISFSLKEFSHVTIEIYNVKGQRVRTLVNGDMEAGYHTVVWNGRNDQGREAGSGIFFYRMKSGSYNSTKKMILMK
ncbi:MAG: carboxypeptidase regulatory-like domain-containing protein [Candidatus Cloacimonetes bacterium]|nr:carboxypeptidase regulatory-like domain-containing protein [Candidatus Cloacimonadota bacterium]